MIVTKSWLEEFIDLSDISNEKLYETFNAIGLEVDSIKEISIPESVVVGKVLSCQKHPDADKLSVCQIDTGEGIRQIVCGAANVADAQFVAVAMVGAVLPGDFHIKPTEIRGEQSDGMVCSSNEIGLPKINNGIMILDDSIGVLDVGRELSSYPKMADTIIELELTANRGDCLSIRGVARDLSAVLERDMKSSVYTHSKGSSVAIARRLNVSNNTQTPVDLLYRLSQSDAIGSSLLIDIRLAFVGIGLEKKIANMLSYATHATGVILRAYDAVALQGDAENISLSLSSLESGLLSIEKGDNRLSIVGVNQSDLYPVSDDSKEILFEASYIEPESIIEGVANSKVTTDALYYKTSRGSEPDLMFGLTYLESQCTESCSCNFSDSFVSVETAREQRLIAVNFQELDDIIGQKIGKSVVRGILSRLGFGITGSVRADSFGVSVPQHRHDIYHIQDIAEEILRIVGINNIRAKPLRLTEKIRLTDSTLRYRAKRDLRLRAVGRGFFEAVTYAFSDQVKLEKYGFAIVDESMRLVNPIAEEFSAMRSTILINLLDSVKRNISYGIKRIPLFEIGTVFNETRAESEKIAFVWSGQASIESVSNHGKVEMITFASFVDRISAVIGDIDLTPCKEENGLMHPYQSARVLKDGKDIGYISKLHPLVTQHYGIPDTFIAEFDFEPLMPKHITAKPISNYQGVYKDLSVVVKDSIAFEDIARAIDAIDEQILRFFYPVDVYKDESLKDQKSVTIRFFIQSMEGTMSDKIIDAVMREILAKLERDCGATLR